MAPFCNFVVFMKKVFRNITSVIMAMLVLFSTLSFTINSHFCGDTLVDSTLFRKAKTCGMQMEAHDSSSESMMDCCSNEEEHIAGQDELQLSVDTLSLEQQLWFFSFTYTYYFFFEADVSKDNVLREYPPPILVKRIYQLDETYLI